MVTRPAQELLYDSEASLRLVDNAIRELGAELDIVTTGDASALPQSLVRAYSDITGILARLHESRNVLEHGGTQKLTHMNEKLTEVTLATETAATEILDGLERTVMMVDELDVLAHDPAGAPRAATVRAQMREELFGLVMHMQFQDITAQQLAYASSVIVEMEQRLAQMAALLDPQALGLEAVALMRSPTAPGDLFDPHATTAHAADRQAVADEVFATRPR